MSNYKYSYTTHLDGLELKDFATLRQAKAYVTSTVGEVVWESKWDFVEDRTLAILWCFGDSDFKYDCSITRRKILTP